MLLRIFKSHQPLVLVLIPIVGLLLWLKAFYAPSPETFYFDSLQMPLYEWTTIYIEPTSLFGVILAFILIVIQALFINRFNTVFIFIEERTNLPALFFVLIASCFAGLQRLHPTLFANVFLLFAIYKLLKTYKKEKAYSHLFDAAFLLSLGSLFYAGLLYFFVPLWIGMFIIRPFSFRELIITVVGLITPYSIITTYYYYTDALLLWRDKLISNLTFIDIFDKLDLYYYIFFGVFIFFVLTSLISLVSGITSSKISSRKYFLFFFWFMVISFAVMGVSFGTSLEVIVIAAIPLSYIFTQQFLSYRPGFWSELWFTILVASIFVIRYLN